MIQLYDKISFAASREITRIYSTSFSKAVGFLDRGIRDAIYSIYGFVRLADEIVDTFHEFDKKHLLEKFETDYYDALDSGISLNPVLNAFVITVKKYRINDDLIKAFLKSMKIDLVKTDHNTADETDEYIFGSAEVVGLMCLNVFAGGDEKTYNDLKEPARKLGSAFQKVNFLRDLKNDIENLNRSYFHNLKDRIFNEAVKAEIIEDIEKDFESSVSGIRKLPESSRFGVTVAYYYYKSLLNKIKHTRAERLMHVRIRISDPVKLTLTIKAWFACKMGRLK